MFGDIQELLVIFIIALLVVGPKKLPEVAKVMGRFLGELKRALSEVRFELDQELGAQSRREQAQQEASRAGQEMEIKADWDSPAHKAASDGPEAGSPGHESGGARAESGEPGAPEHRA